jgi:hypothetical protein
VFRQNGDTYNEVIIGNDGGVVYSADYGNAADASPSFSERNTGYNVTQFYGISMKNISGDGYIIGAGFVHKKRWGFKKLIYLFYESKINL